MNDVQPTPEQLAALQRFQERHGATWKAKLRELWMCEPGSKYQDGAVLRQVRNQLGPKWLTTFKGTK
jgi:hypothetical protein